MLTPTKPFKNTVTNYPDEPSLRIGRAVPKNAVNLAYYYNPTALGSEKVLTAEAPRKTIDHKVEDGYRYLFDQVEKDDSLFPTSIYYEDNEGYSGRLGRMWTRWYDETHVATKNIKQDNLVIVANKEDVPKTLAYKNGDYEGTLFFDTADYVVTKTRHVDIYEKVSHEVKNFEINYKKITGNYIDADVIDAWMNTAKWPSAIKVEKHTMTAEGGANIIQQYINSKDNIFDEYIGFLSFDTLEMEPVKVSEPVHGTDSLFLGLGVFKLTKYEWDDYFSMPDPSQIYDGVEGERDTTENQKEDASKPLSDAEAEAEIEAERIRKQQRLAEIMYDIENNEFKSSYMAVYDRVTDTYDYTEIIEFMQKNLNSSRSQSSTSAIENAIIKLSDVMNKNGDIVIKRTGLYTDVTLDNNYSGTAPTPSNYSFWATATYEYRVTTRPVTGTIAYNVIATYKGNLEKDELVDSKDIATEYSALCHYSGVVRSVTHSYDGQAYYRGSVTKGNSISNIVNDELDNEMLMYSDDTGLLRRQITVYDDDGTSRVKDEYAVEGEYFYLTNVFKDNIPCFYKYDLKEYLYDYKGPDANGYYDGNSVSIRTAAFKDVPETYKYRLKLTPINDSEGRCVKYSASLYTSFLSQATDTFKVTYNAFADSSNGTAEVTPGVTEEVYGYPYMYQNIDYDVISVEEESRTNMIKLKTPYVLTDSRRYVTFSYRLKAHADAIINNGTVIREAIDYESHERTASILNVEYAATSELSKFDGRAYIISDKSDGVYLSPADIIFRDMSEDNITINNVSRNDGTFLYTAEITNVQGQGHEGGINLKCSPDGSGLLTAETTIDTGFWDSKSGSYTGRLSIDSQYLFSGDKIYPGVMVKFVDSRNIFVKPPRNDGLLESWYPLIQFGHYSQEFNQNGAKMKISYSMPEYDNQHYSSKWKRPYADITKENVEILNSHTVKTKCYPLLVYKYEPGDDDTVRSRNGYIYKIFTTKKQYSQAVAECSTLGGFIAMPKDLGTNEFLMDMASAAGLDSIWIGSEYDNSSAKNKWTDGTTIQYSNYSDTEIPNVSNPRAILDLSDSKWHSKSAGSSYAFICQIPMASTTINIYKRMNDELFALSIKDISYKDGIVFLNDTVSENDDIVADYTYVEENYVYRGFWRDKTDFARIDLNPNIYHTYNDMRYVPSVVKPSKNLFNSVIYFFLKPSISEQQQDEPQLEENETLDKVIDPDTGKFSYKITSKQMIPIQTPYTDYVVSQEPVYTNVPKYREEFVYDVNDIGTSLAVLTPSDLQAWVTSKHAFYYPVRNRAADWSYITYLKPNNAISNVPLYSGAGPYKFAYDASLGSFIERTINNTRYKDDESDFGFIVSNNHYGAYGFRATFCSDSDDCRSISYVIAGNDEWSENIYENSDNRNNRYPSNSSFYAKNLLTLNIAQGGNRGFFRNKDNITEEYYQNHKAFYNNGSTNPDDYKSTVVYLSYGHYVLAMKEIRNHQTLNEQHQVTVNGSTVTRYGKPMNQIAGISIFVVKTENTLKAWVKYNDDSSWTNGIMPSEEPDINFTFTSAEYTTYPGLQNRMRVSDSSDNRIGIITNQLGLYLKNAMAKKVEKTSVQVFDHYEREITDYNEIRTPITKYRTTYEERDVVRYVPIVSNSTYRNSTCLYHQIDDFIPESDMDLYIGSVYIRQNTSLHSTVIIDSRTRGGGVLTSISEGLRHELEPESDYYLDIGYYDGKPYQENGVIIVKLDRKLLKDFGGRFTYSDIENKVHRWLGYGVFPIIEYVDAYEQNNLPQNTLEVDDMYANMQDIIPEIYLETVDI